MCPDNSIHPWLVERVDTCIAPWTTATVDHAGGVHPCCASHREIGHLRSASFEAIWNGDAARQLRWFLLHGLIHPICRGIACPYVRNTLAAGEPAELRAAVEAELDEEDYCARYPDVAAAIARGEFRAAREHYRCFGRDECRMARFYLDRVTPTAAPVSTVSTGEENSDAPAGHWVFRFDEGAYRAAYREADRLIRRGIFTSGLEHFFKVGARKTTVPWWQCEGVSDGAWRHRSDVRALHAYASGALEVPVLPIHFAVSLTSRCNLRCVMCPHGVGMIAEPADTPLAFADQLRAALGSALRIELVGVGEPLLSPFFRRIVDERTFRPEAYVRTNTNGQLLTPETRTWLLASDLKEVSVSFDAATAATYEYIRGGDFARLVRNVAALASERRRCGRAAAPEIWINFTIMQANAAECEAFVRAAAALDAYGVEFSLLNGYGDHSDWVVRRGDCVFRYHDNMADRDLPTVRHHLTRALEEGGRLGLPVRLRMLAEEREKLNLHQEGYC